MVWISFQVQTAQKPGGITTWQNISLFLKLSNCYKHLSFHTGAVERAFSYHKWRLPAGPWVERRDHGRQAQLKPFHPQNLFIHPPPPLTSSDLLGLSFEAKSYRQIQSSPRDTGKKRKQNTHSSCQNVFSDAGIMPGTQ